MEFEQQKIAINHRKESAELVHRNYRYAKNHLRGNPAERFRQFKQLAEKGHARSMCEVGPSYIKGTGTEPNLDEGEMWLRRAVDLGDFWGYWVLGRLYFRQKRYEEARKTLAIAAAAGFSPALHDMGKIYLLGLGVEEDLPKAKDYFERAMNAGSLFAKARLGRVLLKDSHIGSKLKGAYFLLAAIIELFPILFTKGPNNARLVE
jgi:TPR repeat protein